MRNTFMTGRLIGGLTCALWSVGACGVDDYASDMGVGSQEDSSIGQGDTTEASQDDVSAQAKVTPKTSDLRAQSESWSTGFISVLRTGTNTGTMVIDITDASKADGARAQLWTHSAGAEHQAWSIIQSGTFQDLPTYWLINEHSGKCLDMAIDGPVGNGTRVQQWKCSGASANQEWIPLQVSPLNSGWVELRNRMNNTLCLDVTEANYHDGAKLQVWNCGGNWNQRWNIYP